MTNTAHGRRHRPHADLMSQRRDMISRLADAGLPERQAAADVDALCEAALVPVAEHLALQIASVRHRRDAALDWITRDSLILQLRGLVSALATALGDPHDTKAAHGYARGATERSQHIA
ncbi:hypothetical protein ACODT5_01110 [Streptomyces sp. 5.8]|uniref:hypothetical protein n=1 Tax=Streptomyces sp. 5.8 TaxID=3406571 RepID=UPI003BB77C9A